MTKITLIVITAALLIFGSMSAVWAERDAGIAAYKKNEFATALQELKPAAEAGDAKAQYYLGLLHSHGYGVEKNHAIAATWFRKAADQGYQEAQFDLGHLYSQGAGVPQDDSIAVSWWRKAADKGDTFAQSSLADMYLDGRGVERDLIEAYKWIILAEPRAQPNRVRWNTFTARKIAKMMKPGQLAKAQKLVKQWLRARQ